MAHAAHAPELTYEEALKRLERIVTELDGAELALDARLKKFEDGTKLARLLLKKLDQAKKKVQMLVKTNVGDAALVPVEDDAFEDAAATNDRAA